MYCSTIFARRGIIFLMYHAQKNSMLLNYTNPKMYAFFKYYYPTQNFMPIKIVHLQVKSIQTRLPSTKSSLASTSSKSALVKSGSKKIITSCNRKISDLELKIQEMRENIAAKKIQRTWRHHQKYVSHSFFMF